MSVNLSWRPASTQTNVLPYALYSCLHRAGEVFPLRIDKIDVGFYEGLEAAGIEGASDIVKALRKNDSIILELEF